MLVCKQAVKYFLKHRKILLNQKRKMLKGKSFCASFDVGLFSEKQHCKDLCNKFNNTSPQNIALRYNIIKKILGKTGNFFLIEQPFMCDYGYNIEIGENFCSNHNLLILDSARVVIGDNVLIGPNCSFYTSLHPKKHKIRNLGIEKAEGIKIGNNVWIGGNVVILSGVSVGDNSIIGAGSVVVKDVPKNCIALGNPCKMVKKLN